MDIVSKMVNTFLDILYEKLFKYYIFLQRKYKGIMTESGNEGYTDP